MTYHFTPAAERAPIHASGWSNRTDCDELEAVPLLVGLLSESECRAAATLARWAIDVPAILERWPTLVEIVPRQGGLSRWKSFSKEVDLGRNDARKK
jgi:hypothetical protein